MPKFRCKVCDAEFERRGMKPATFCSIACKAAWQREQKPVDRAWLVQKYINEGLGTYQIAKLVNRNPKQVFHWLKGYGIPIRQRTWSIDADKSKPYQQEDWLRNAYVTQGKSTGDIASEFGVTEENILFFLRRYGIDRRTVSEARAIKHWGSSGERNPMYGKRGAEVPNWKGGITPERNAFYSSVEWKRVARAVRARDRWTCQRCGKGNLGRRNLHLHHLISFAVESERANPDNLITLCKSCHLWVHSNANVNREFIREGGG